MKAEKCPVCNGVGLVSGGFYSRPGDCEAWVASEMMEKVHEETGLIHRRLCCQQKVTG